MRWVQGITIVIGQLGRLAQWQEEKEIKNDINCGFLSVLEHSIRGDVMRGDHDDVWIEA